MQAFAISRDAFLLASKNELQVFLHVALVQRNLHCFFLNKRIHFLLQAVACIRKFLFVVMDDFFCLACNFLRGRKHLVPTVRNMVYQALGGIGGCNARLVGDFVQKAAVNFVTDADENG